MRPLARESAAGGRNANDRFALAWLRVLRNRLPALTASLVVRDRSYVVESPPSQVTVTDGPTVRSVVCAPTPGSPPPPRKVCWLAVSRRRYRNRALIIWTIAPPAPLGGVRFQLADPDGHSRLLVSSGTWSLPRSTHVSPRVRWQFPLTRRPRNTWAPA